MGCVFGFFFLHFYVELYHKVPNIVGLSTMIHIKFYHQFDYPLMCLKVLIEWQAV